MPFNTGLTFTYDCGEFAKTMDMALDAADLKGFEARRAASHRAASCAASASPTRSRAAPAGLEGAEIRFDRTGAVSMLSGSITQGQGHETAFKQIVCDRLGLDPNEVKYLQGDTDQVFFAEGTGGSRSATFRIGLHACGRKGRDQGQGDRRPMLKVELDDMRFADGIFSSPKTNQTLTINEVAKASLEPEKLPKAWSRA